MDPVTVEATAALHAVELCRDVGVQDLILEGDSMVVVKAIESSGQKTQIMDRSLKISEWC